MSHGKLTRREFFGLGGAALTVLSSGVVVPVFAQADPIRIRCQRNYNIGRYYFEPTGLYLQPGQRVQWYIEDAALEREGFSAVAYHPDNQNHELRIPEGARPFDSAQRSGGDAFEWTFDVEGTYDYYSRGQEMIGMVGRIIVGKPGGPGEKSPGYGSREGRHPMYKDVIRTFQALIRRNRQQESAPLPSQRTRPHVSVGLDGIAVADRWVDGSAAPRST